jgi:hypothetical protein
MSQLVKGGGAGCAWLLYLQLRKSPHGLWAIPTDIAASF